MRGAMNWVSSRAKLSVESARSNNSIGPQASNRCNIAVKFPAFTLAMKFWLGASWLKADIRLLRGLVELDILQLC